MDIVLGLWCAYIGPGATAGAIAVVLGVIGSFILAIFSLLWYPFKRLIRRIRGNTVAEGESADPGDE